MELIMFYKFMIQQKFDYITQLLQLYWENGMLEEMVSLIDQHMQQKRHPVLLKHYLVLVHFIGNHPNKVAQLTKDLNDKLMDYEVFRLIQGFQHYGNSRIQKA